MLLVDWIEQRGAYHWGERYPDRDKYGDEVAKQYGVARIWGRISLWFYIVAVVLLVAPVGHALYFVGGSLAVVGLAPLTCWFAERMKFRKAVKLLTK